MDKFSSSANNEEKLEIEEPSILLRINRTFRNSMTALELYAYTRGCWVVNPKKAKRARYAFAVYDGIIQEVYDIAAWFRAGTTYSVREDIEDLRNLYEFVGNIAPEDIQKKYKLKSVGYLFKKGNVNPIMYINIEN